MSCLKYIKNPETGKYVDIKSNDGQSVLSQFIKVSNLNIQLGGSKSQLLEPKHQVFNKFFTSNSILEVLINGEEESFPKYIIPKPDVRLKFTPR